MTDTTETTEAPRLNRRALSKRETFAKVTEAARALFAAEGGYEAATIRSIAKAAGMSTGAVFASYTNKAEIYQAIYGHKPVTPEQGRRLLELMSQAENARWGDNHPARVIFAEVGLPPEGIVS